MEENSNSNRNSMSNLEILQKLSLGSRSINDEIIFEEMFKISYEILENNQIQVTLSPNTPKKADKSSALFSIWSQSSLSVEEITDIWAEALKLQNGLDLLIQGLTYCKTQDSKPTDIEAQKQEANDKSNSCICFEVRKNSRVQDVEKDEPVRCKMINRLVFVRSLIDLIERKQTTIAGLKLVGFQIVHESFKKLCEYGDEKLLEFFLNAAVDNRPQPPNPQPPIKVEEMRIYMDIALRNDFDKVALCLLQYIEKQDNYQAYYPLEIDYTSIGKDKESFDVSRDHLLMRLYKHQSLLDNSIVHRFITLKWFGYPGAIYFGNLVLYAAFLFVFNSYAVTVLVFGNINYALFPLQKTILGMAYFYLILSGLFNIGNYVEYLMSSTEEKILVKGRFSYFNLALDLFMYPTSLILVYDDSMFFNSRSTLFSLTIIVGYISLALRFEEFPVIGVYVKVMMSVIKQSLKMLPIFIIVYIGFVTAFFFRSGFTNLKGNYRTEQLRSDLQMTKFNNTYVVDMIVLLALLGGDLQAEELGLSNDMNSQNFGNYALVFTFMFFCVMILYNLFVGLATYAIDEYIKKSTYHSLQSQIYYIVLIEEFFYNMLKIFSDNSFKQWYIGYFLSPLRNITVTKPTKPETVWQYCKMYFSEQKKRRILLFILNVFYFFIFFFSLVTMSVAYNECIYYNYPILLIMFFIADVFAFISLASMILRCYKSK